MKSVVVLFATLGLLGLTLGGGHAAFHLAAHAAKPHGALAATNLLAKQGLSGAAHGVAVATR